MNARAPGSLLVGRAGVPATLGVLAVVFTAATLPALGAFIRAHRGGAVALGEDIRYRPKT
jgi:hypothetical protein